MNRILFSFPRKKFGILLALMIGVFLSPINVNFTSVALPSLRNYYSISVEQVAWIGTAYFIPTVVLMPFFAKVGRWWGLKRIYILGLSLLSFGGFLAAFASNFQWLLFSRVLQGIGWSGLYPLSLILIREHFPLGQQGEMMGIWESAVGFAALIGPVIGGTLVNFFDWPSVYFVIGSIAALGAFLSIFTLPRTLKKIDLPEFDWGGAISFSLGITILLYGITRKSLFLVSLSILPFVIWYINSNKIKNPFVDPKVFRNRNFISSAGAAHIRMLIGLACVMSLPLFFEGVQGLSPAYVGLLLPAYSLFLFLGARPGGRWADRVGSRRPAMIGFAFITFGVFLLTFVNVETSIFFFILAFAIRGIGSGISHSPFAKVAIASLGEDKTAEAAGLYGMIRYSGLVLGSVILGIFLDLRFTFYASSGLGASAVPAFQELYTLLAIFGLLGFFLATKMGKEKPSLIVSGEVSAQGSGG